jgi:hypothetical protein
MSSIPFAASIIDFTQNPPLVNISTDSGCDMFTTIDSSNYTLNNESGHALSDFSVFRRLVINYMNISNYVMSSVPDEPEPFTAIPPASSANNTLIQPLTTGDGWYSFNLQTVPTYNSGASYVAGTNCVWNPTDSNLYLCIQNSTGNRPDLSPLFWTVITEDQLPNKYSVIVAIVTMCQLATCIPVMINNALCGNPNIPCTNLCNNPALINAIILVLIQYGINTSATLGQATNTTNMFNYSTAICNCP